MEFSVLFYKDLFPQSKNALLKLFLTSYGVMYEALKPKAKRKGPYHP